MKQGNDCTLVGVGYSTLQCLEASDILLKKDINCEVIDLRVLNPINFDLIVNSVIKTKKLFVVDGGWKNCGIAGEVIASVSERIPVDTFEKSPVRITLIDTPAPTSKPLEQTYYNTSEDIVNKVLTSFAV